ncbi:poly [ADP-ribose] polymerase tankyrase-1-like [Cloeon dipterum]|uniref:poly [ADP-ribose] polymerase tankyrase-1-like n=1 Tax=Cloeon dipterum TaxID=197152 RepID=UPI00322063CC
MSVLQALRETDPEYTDVVKKMKESIVSHRNGIPLSDYVVTKVEKVVNSKLESQHKSIIKMIKMEMSKEDAANALTLHLYHGSPNAQKIALGGFDVEFSATQNMFGKGIYFAALSSKSNQYAWGNNAGCPQHRSRSCCVCPRQLLLCECFMGKPFKPTRANEPVPRGFHSVIAEPANVSGLRYPEYAILNSAQALPQYLITYNIKP